ncbi:MAG: hypothetical protein HY899_09825, partial [Deltaproteobacteria bacterium]|nr:hypothetical protein [Deltaproteobacteria bacterium]
MHTIRLSRRAGIPLPLLALLCVGGCNSGGGDSERVTIGYAGDASAYGVLIRSGDSQALTKAAAADPPCSMAAAAVAANCNGSVETSAGGLRLALRGCFLQPGDALFNCELSSDQAAHLRSDATVTTGCGCQANCPAVPAISVCGTNAADCQETAASQAATSATTKAQVVSTTTRTTFHNTCSTCCEVDTSPYRNAVLTATQPVTEIEVRLTVYRGCEFSDAACRVEDYFAWGVISSRTVNSTTLRYCLASANPIEDATALPLLQCKDGTVASVAVVRAFGADF